MSVNAVSGATLQRDLVSALRQARAASAKPIDTSTLTTASQDTAATQSTGSTSQSNSGAPTLSNDLMSSLLQLQSDFSQLGLQNGVATLPDQASASTGSATVDATDSSQSADSAAPTRRRHHGHHAPSPAADTPRGAQADSTADATASSSASTSTTATTSDAGEGFNAFLQQITKAIAAYATGGPVGVAAAAVTGSTKV
jgi:hypothetical protein